MLITFTPGRLPTVMTKRGIHPEERPSFTSSENRFWKRRKSSRGNPEFRFQVHSSLTLEHGIRRRRRRGNRSPLVRLSEHSACRNHFQKKGSSPKRTQQQQDTDKNTKKSKNEEDQSLTRKKIQQLGNNVLIKKGCRVLCATLSKFGKTVGRTAEVGMKNSNPKLHRNMLSITNKVM